MDGERGSRDAAREALITSLISYAVQAAILVGITAAVSRPPWLEAALFRARWHLRGRAEARDEAALAAVRRDIARFEHGDNDAAPDGPPGLYGGL